MDINPNEIFDTAQDAFEVSKKYGVNVLLSLGPNGAVAVNGQGTFLVKNPKVEAKSAVGSGDCTVAGLMYGIWHRFPFEQSLSCGVAAGTANTLTIGAGQFKLVDFESARAQVHVLRKV